MELDIPTTIRAQLASFTDDERRQTLAQLEALAKYPDRAGPDLRKNHDDPQLWTVRLALEMRVLLRAEGNRLRVLALATRAQLRPYLTPEAQRAV